jgi:hypothetical protein
MYKLWPPQNTFCPLPGEITNCLLILPLQTNVFFSLSVFFWQGRAGKGREGQGRAGQGENIMTFCGLTVGNLSFCLQPKKLLKGKNFFDGVWNEEFIF